MNIGADPAAATGPDAAATGRGGPTTAAPAVPALTASALRCVVLYVLVPVLTPALGTVRWVATPVAVALLAVGTMLSARAFWRALRLGAAGMTLLTSVLLSLNLLAIVSVRLPSR